MTDRPPPTPAPYPTMETERIAWHRSGTPREFTPYSSTSADAYRDGLLAQARFHNPRPPAPAPAAQAND